MAMLGPPFVRGLLVGSDPQNAAGLHRELANDRCFEVYGWIHQSPEHVSGSRDRYNLIGSGGPLEPLFLASLPAPAVCCRR